MKNKGFSLVELIVVIAIMAILVGVAVPVYTNYIDKANKSKDEQLVDEIKHALQIELVAENKDATNFGGGVVITLSEDGAATVTKDGASADDADVKFVKDALTKVFGADWANTLKLSYDEWESSDATTVVANYVGSSYVGNEKELLDQVQVLSGLLSTFVGKDDAAVIGSGFGQFIADNGVTSNTAIGNSAVLYVAQTMTGEGVTADSVSDALNAWATVAMGTNTIDITSDEALAFIDACGGSMGAAAATMYAAAEGFAQSAGDAEWFHGEVETKLAEVDGAGTALKTLLNTFTDLGRRNASAASDYLVSGLGKDVDAYVSVLGAITEAEDSILENMDSESCYTDGTLLAKLNAYITVGTLNVAEGCIAIVLNVNANGTIDIVAYPLDF